MTRKEGILLQLLNDTFNKSTISQIEKNYLGRVRGVTKWMCFSDYCLDDKNKPNDVVTFSLVPYILEYDILEKIIKEYAKTDIKKTRSINDKYMEFLRKYPIINFSFIINDRKSLYGKTHSEVRRNLKHDYLFIKDMYNIWIQNEPKKKKQYSIELKRINACLDLIDKDKKIKQLVDVVLIPMLGAYVSNIILNKVNKLDIFGWFSDRDKLLDIEKGIAINFFHNNLHGLIDNKNFQFVSSNADCTFDIFYDHFIKIPDYIVGTLADYDLENNSISKDKFEIVLKDYMGNNKYNNHIFRIAIKNGYINCSKVIVKKN